MKSRILLVEDELNLAAGLKLNFELEGNEVATAGTVEDGRAAIQASSFELIILDVMLPDGSGFDFLQEIKKKDVRQPVILLTARASDDDRITGLSLGADDYVTKPFRLEELLLRVKGILRRSNWYRAPVADLIQIGEARLNPVTGSLEKNGHTFQLTEYELKLLMHLWNKQGEYVSRQELLSEIWGYSPNAITRTVDIFVSRLRRLIGDDGNSPTFLLTKRGQGYMLAKPQK